MPELQTPVEPKVATRPRLALVGMHIRGLRAIERFDLPEDGLGWQGEIPDLVLLAGINGSGKTTLMNFIVECLSLLPFFRQGVVRGETDVPTLAEASEAWVDFEFESNEGESTRFRILVGDSGFLAANRTETTLLVQCKNTNAWMATTPYLSSVGPTINKLFSLGTFPSVVFLPSENRALSLPKEAYKTAGSLIEDRPFVHRWQPPALWKESLEAYLYSLRWEDLNAKEEGRHEDSHHVASYAEAFHKLTEGRKSLAFEGGKLVVRVVGSHIAHDLAALSSGERQLLVMLGELVRYWRPGSLVLIDEPELHLHARWQTLLYDSLRHWQKERGGQIILATQSPHLIELAGPGTAALLGMEPL